MFGALKKIKDRIVDFLEAQINKPRDGWGNPAQAHGSPLLVEPLYRQDDEEPVEAPSSRVDTRTGKRLRAPRACGPNCAGDQGPYGGAFCLGGTQCANPKKS